MSMGQASTRFHYEFREAVSVGAKIGILKETKQYEKRVAASPETVKKLINLKCDVIVESHAGETAMFFDEDYKNAGAMIAKSRGDIFKTCDIVLCVQAPSAAEIKTLRKDACIFGIFAPHANADALKAFKEARSQAFSMELIPRITRAQAMDVLSSQANLAGYKSVLDATAEFGRAMPMMMTAAGTVPPAKVFIMGAGVAGLQAIATAKRLGAVVTATDVRPAAKEQVESLGGSFVAVEDDEFKQAETSGGYAKEMSKEYQAKQAALVEEHITKQDIVITTALIPGRPAPKLITEEMVGSMKPGSVIVDLAVEAGGNCAGSKLGEIVTKGGVKIIGHANVPSRLARDASALYARNIYNFLALIIDPELGKLNINWEDDIVKGTILTKDGAIVHPNFVEQKKATPKAATTEKKSEEKPKAAANAKPTANKAPAAKKAPAKKAPAKKTAAKPAAAKKPSTTSKSSAVKKTTAAKPAAKKS